MKSIFFLLLQSICLFAAPAPVPAPEPYVETQYVEVSVLVQTAYLDRSITIPAVTYELTIEVYPTITPTKVLETIIDSTSFPEITVVQLLLSPGSVPEITSNSYTPSTAYTHTVSTPETLLMVPLTYTPPSSCSKAYQHTTWSIVTSAEVFLPSSLTAAITPVSVSTVVTSYMNYYYDRVTTSTYYVAILNPTDVPQTELAYASQYNKPYGLAFCYTPTTACYTYAATGAAAAAKSSCATYLSDDYASYSGFGTGPSSTKNSYDYGWGLYYQWRLIIIIVVMAFVVLVFVCGLFQSWRSFKGLMLGKKRSRGAPGIWFLISCWCLCFMGPTYKAKSEEEQAILAARWKEMGGNEKFLLWCKWGLRWKYPTVLGTEPDIHTKALRQRLFE